MLIAHGAKLLIKKSYDQCAIFRDIFRFPTSDTDRPLDEDGIVSDIDSRILNFAIIFNIFRSAFFGYISIPGIACGLATDIIQLIRHLHYLPP
jgi:hypothetical protein